VQTALSFDSGRLKYLLHCMLAAAQSIVVGPVCVFVAAFVCSIVGLLPR